MVQMNDSTGSKGMRLDELEKELPAGIAGPLGT